MAPRIARRVLSSSLALLLLAPWACDRESDPDGDDSIGGGGDHGGAGGDDAPGEEEYVCYFESRASYTCSDGDGDPGTWDATCSAITEEACGGPDFIDQNDYIDGCIFTTEWQSEAWLPKAECEARLPGASSGTPGDDGSTGGDSTGGSTGGSSSGGDDDPSTTGGSGPSPYGACSSDTDCSPDTPTCVQFETGSMCSTSCGGDSDCPAPANTSTESFCAIPYDIYYCLVDCAAGDSCPDGTTCYGQESGQNVCL